MQVDATKAQLAWYLRNCLRSDYAHRLQGVLIRHLPLLLEATSSTEGCDCPECRGQAADEALKGESPRRSLQRLRRTLAQYVDIPESDEPLEQNALFAQEEFGLDEVDLGLLQLVLRYERNRDLEHLADATGVNVQSPTLALAALINAEARTVRDRLRPGGALVDQGILTTEHNDEHVMGLAGTSGRFRLSPPLRRVMFRPCDSREQWTVGLMGSPLATPLAWADFEHLGGERDLAVRVLSGEMGRRQKGLNLLLHGPVGTGKTEFCKALAREAGRTLWSAGEKDEEGGEPSRSERLAGLRLLQRMLKDRADALLLFDEAEDLLVAADGPARSRRDESKVFINRTVEENPVPVLWTCNDVQHIPPAVLRRMTLALEIKTPNQAVRGRIMGRALLAENVQVADEAVRDLTARYPAPPAIITSAARAAALAGGGAAEIELAMAGVLRVLHIAPTTDERSRGSFDPALTRCDTDLLALADRLATPGAPHNWSLCLHGAPGTGKSLYARYLAGRLGMEVMHRRASDLLSMWVGETEKQIAEAFADARREGAMLIIDEAESLFADRRDAVRSWEVTQVNEMLTWMESHPLPFVCTTNLMDRLDQASLRRFTLKLRFEPLNTEQAVRGAVSPTATRLHPGACSPSPPRP
jgi:transitional endoplasmic reticulum ATPase